MIDLARLRALSPAAQRLAVDIILSNDLDAFIMRAAETVSPGDQFVPNWHIRAMAYELMRIATGDNRQLMICVPPRSLKSVATSVAFSAFLLGLDPSLRIICISYSRDLAVKHANDCRSVMTSSWYRRLFPNTRISARKNTETEVVTTGGGSRLATSVGGTLTGRGGDAIILDDPLQPEDAYSDARREEVNRWIDTTLSTRLNDKRFGRMIVVMQRLHVDDPVGHLLRDDAESWEMLSLPAIAQTLQRIPLGNGEFKRRRPGDILHPEREPLEILDGLKRRMGSAAFSAQYLQSPVPADGNLVNWEWFQTYSGQPSRAPRDFIVQSWDTATKDGEQNDFSVGLTLLVKGNEYYVLDIVRAKLQYPSLRRRLIEEANAWWPAYIVVEESLPGQSLIQDLRSMHLPGLRKPIGVRPEGDKVQRMNAALPAIEARQVFVPERADWIEDFKVELLAFPYGRHDDQVDALSQAIIWIEKEQRLRRMQQGIGGSMSRHSVA